MLEVKASNPFFRATWGFPGVSGHAVKVGWGSNGHPLSQCGRQAADYLKESGLLGAKFSSPAARLVQREGSLPPGPRRRP